MQAFASIDAISAPPPWFQNRMETARRADRSVHPAGAVPPRDPLWTVQVMRGAAALMVVIGHGQSAVAGALHGAFARSTLAPWGAGVDLFFVISGFIIVHAARPLFGTPAARREFLRRRLVRIVPLYWLATTSYLLLLAVAALKGGDPFPRPDAIFASYAFIPADSFGNGRLFPVFDLGWTLNYEMYFYALLASVLVLPRRRALAALGSGIAAMVLLGTAVTTGPPAVWFWTRPIVVDFGWGVAVGALYGAGFRLPGAVRPLLAVGALAVLLADPGHLFNGAIGVTVANDWPRVWSAGLPVAVLLGAAVLGPEPVMPGFARPFTRIGDASYSLYLLHPFALIVMEKLVQKLAPVPAPPGWLIAWTTVAASIALGLAGYRWIERPLTRAVGRGTLAFARSSGAVPAL